MSKGFFTLQPSAPSKGHTAALCGLCGLHTGCLSPKMPPTGAGQRGLLLVAEAPGKTEDERNTQLVGDAGKRLRDHAENLGLEIDRDCWKTNAVICRPPKNRTPKPEEIDACRPHLLAAIKELKPKVIVLLGGTAVQSLLGPLWGSDVGPLDRWVGWQIPTEYGWVVPNYHPSFLLRVERPVLNLLFEQYLQRAIDLTDTPCPPIEDLTSSIQVEVRPEVAAKVIRKIAASSLAAGIPIAFDFETRSLKPEVKGTYIYSCSFSNGQRTIAFPWVGEAKEAAIEVLHGPNCFLNQNIQFEQRWCQLHAGGGVENWCWDTMLATHVLDNRSDICSLKFQAFVQFGQRDYSKSVKPYMEEGRNGLNKLNEANLPTVLLYNGMDSLLTWRLAMLQKAKLNEQRS